jgi:hypothetical protein
MIAALASELIFLAVLLLCIACVAAGYSSRR